MTRSNTALATALHYPGVDDHVTLPNLKPDTAPPIQGEVPGVVQFRQPPQVRCESKFLRVNGRRFWIKGVTYGTFAPNEEGEPYPPLETVRRDFAQMRAAGINTVRLYTPPSDALADAAADAGLYLIPDICWGPRRCQLDSAEDVEFMRQWIRSHARRLAAHPAILMYSLGNEIPPLLVRWYGRKRIQDWLRELYEIAKEEAPARPVTYVNHPPTEYLDLGFLDVVSWNIYLERETEFRAYLSRLQMLAGDAPVFLAELGLDSQQHGEIGQRDFLASQIRAVFEKGFCGVAVYSWTDEWQIFDSQVNGWSFGVTTAERRPKPALRAVQRAYSASHCERRLKPLPMVSVIVCAYNAAAYLDQCLNSLTRLNYPDYEVIVVDDGSTDNTSDIARRQGVRLINAGRGGLSCARNVGIQAANGSLVAFIDADASADPDWLFFLVSALEEQEASAVGGPNLSPPHDGFIARCVNHSPGNPTHVLLDHSRAEHVPGCNMAFRKDALKRVGSFDPTHRAAGDDVDVCWKLRAREETIAFHPAAFVWHHRRPALRSFLRQQRGYGYAEAHLHHRYPGHYNLFGHAVWRGGIYDGLHSAAVRTDFGGLLQSRIYQGHFGCAQFQAIYPSCRSHWFQLFTTVEWMLVALCLLAASLLAIPQSSIVAATLLACAGAGALATLTAAALAGATAAQTEKWRGWRKLAGASLVGFLHIAQPFTRAQGRLRGWLKLCRKPSPFQADQHLYGNLAQRDAWLHRLQTHLANCGWIARPAGQFDDADIDILGPGPFAMRLQSVYEENLEKARHYVRYRVSPRWTLKTAAYLATLATGVTGAILSGLWPLAVPLLFFLFLVVRAQWTHPRAISQLAAECGEGLGMVPVIDNRP